MICLIYEINIAMHTLCNFLLVSSILLCNSSRFFTTSASPLACFVAFTTAALRTLLLPLSPPLLSLKIYVNFQTNLLNN